MPGLSQEERSSQGRQHRAGVGQNHRVGHGKHRQGVVVGGHESNTTEAAEDQNESGTGDFGAQGCNPFPGEGVKKYSYPLVMSK